MAFIDVLRGMFAQIGDDLPEDAEPTDTAPPPDEFTLLFQGGSLTLNADAALTPDEPDAPPSFQRGSASDFYSLQTFLKSEYGLGTSSASALLNEWGANFFSSRGRFPQPWELMSDGDFITAAQRMQFGTDLLPPAFVMDGQLYVNGLQHGVLPVPGLDPEVAFLNRVQGTLPQSIAEQIRQDNRFPEFTMDQIMGLLNLPSPRGGGGGGRRGGGGGGFRAPVFDDDQLRDAIRQRWRAYLREEPDDLEALVSAFKKDFTAFARQGGQKDLDSWVLAKARPTARYRTLYSRKPEAVGELEYLNGFVQQTAAFGLNPMEAERRITAGASGGVGLTSFANQTSTTAGATAANVGSYSRRFAQSMAELGPMMRG